MKIYSAVVHMLLFAMVCNPCFGHGIQHKIYRGGVCVETQYNDGTPISYCEVTLFSPVDAETEFQEGFTDRNGRFVFFPDAQGAWHIIIDDDMGHVLKEDIKINEGMLVTQTESHQRPDFWNILVGISLIFGIFGVLALFYPFRRSRGGRH